MRAFQCQEDTQECARWWQISLPSVTRPNARGVYGCLSISLQKRHSCWIGDLWGILAMRPRLCGGLGIADKQLTLSKASCGTRMPMRRCALKGGEL